MAAAEGLGPRWQVSAQSPASLIKKETLIYEVYKERISKYDKKEEWILILKKQLDRIYRIVRIERPSAEGPVAAGEKIPSIL